mgnify:CR=1 FL=1
MARVRLDIHDPPDRATLKAMLERSGHVLVAEGEDILITDDCSRAAAPGSAPVLAAVRPGDIPLAVAAMRNGAYGYIALPPQPGEADIAIRHALQSALAADSGEAPAMTLEAFELEYILSVLRRCKGNQAKAARLLGIGRNTLWRKLRRMNRD